MTPGFLSGKPVGHYIGSCSRFSTGHGERSRSYFSTLPTEKAPKVPQVTRPRYFFEHSSSVRFFHCTKGACRKKKPVSGLRRSLSAAESNSQTDGSLMHVPSRVGVANWVANR